MHFRTRIQFGVARARPFARKCSIFSLPRLESATPIGRAACLLAGNRERSRARLFKKYPRARDSADKLRVHVARRREGASRRPVSADRPWFLLGGPASPASPPAAAGARVEFRGTRPSRRRRMAVPRRFAARARRARGAAGGESRASSRRARESVGLARKRREGGRADARRARARFDSRVLLRLLLRC